MKGLRSAIASSLAILLLLQCQSLPSKRLNVSTITPFGVCYTKVKPEQTGEYKLLILEPDHYTSEELKELKASGQMLIGYISLGEVNPGRWYFDQMQQIGFLGKNENWNSYYLDLSNKEVREFMVQEAARRILAKGFDGLFLDTIDAVAPYTERSELAGDMLSLITSLRQEYKESVIIQNAGLFILPDSKSIVDAVLLEDIATLYDFESDEYVVLPDSLFKERLAVLNEAQSGTDLPFMVIDFAQEERSISEVRTRLNPLGFPYFISSIGLDTLPPDPEFVSNRMN